MHLTDLLRPPPFFPQLFSQSAPSFVLRAQTRPINTTLPRTHPARPQARGGLLNELEFIDAVATDVLGNADAAGASPETLRALRAIFSRVDVFSSGAIPWQALTALLAASTPSGGVAGALTCYEEVNPAAWQQRRAVKPTRQRHRLEAMQTEESSACPCKPYSV